MKLFEIYTEGVRVYVSGKTNIAALKYYLDEIGYTLDDCGDHDYIEEIPQSEWGNYSTTDPDTGKHISTFAQEMEGMTGTNIIAIEQ